MQPVSSQNRFGQLPPVLKALIAGLVADEVDANGKLACKDVAFPYLRLAKSFRTPSVQNAFFKVRGASISSLIRRSKDPIRFVESIPEYVKNVCELLDLSWRAPLLTDIVLQFPNLRELYVTQFASPIKLPQLKKLRIGLLTSSSWMPGAEVFEKLESFSCKDMELVTGDRLIERLACSSVLTSLDLYGFVVSAERLQLLQKLPLRILRLKSSTVGEKHLAVFEHVDSLQELHLARCSGRDDKLTYECVARLAKSSCIQKIVLWKCLISGDRSALEKIRNKKKEHIQVEIEDKSPRKIVNAAGVRFEKSPEESITSLLGQLSLKGQ